MNVYEAAQQFLEARQQVRQTRQQQDNAWLTLQEARTALGKPSPKLLTRLWATP